MCLVTIGNPAFCLSLYLTAVHFRSELQQDDNASLQKIKCQPIKTREIGGVTLSDFPQDIEIPSWCPAGPVLPHGEKVPL